MIRALIFLLTYINLVALSQAQETNGKVSSLIAAENYFASEVLAKGLRTATLKVSDGETLLFRPNPIKAEQYFQRGTEDPGSLYWQPVLGRVSRSGDWGFTTGPFTYTPTPGGDEVHGEYLSVWKANMKGVWKLALNMNLTHPKPKSIPELNFIDPKNTKFFRQISPARLQQREDVIITTDKLFSSTIRKNTLFAYDTFLSPEARLLFPGFEPLIGMEAIKTFLLVEEIEPETRVLEADRSIGSDLALTYGTALVTKNKAAKKYNFVRIWESQEGKWNVIVEMYCPAD